MPPPMDVTITATYVGVRTNRELRAHMNRVAKRKKIGGAFIPGPESNNTSY